MLIHDSRAGTVTPDIQHVAQAEGVDEQRLMRDIAQGRVIIPRNRNHYYGGYKYYSPYSNSKGYYAHNDAFPADAALEKSMQSQPSLLSRLGGNPPPVSTLPANADKIPSPDPNRD